MKKLYDIPRNSYVRVLPQQSEIFEDETEDVKVPIGSHEVEQGELIYFHHTDGMYSLCQKVDSETLKHGETCHMAGWTEVELVDLNELFTFEKIRGLIGRSGYGKDGQGEFREATLENMSDNWVSASIEFVSPDHPHRKFYEQELNYRKENSITIEDTEE
jgi:hypothetical protein